MTFEEFRNFCRENIFKNGNSPKTQKLRAYFKYFSERLVIAKNWRSVTEFMWCIINNDSAEHKYCECGNEVTFSEVAGRRKTCGNKDCAEKYAHTEESYNRRHQTCLDKYGVEHFSKTEEYKQKYQATSIERYGVPSFMMNSEQRKKSYQSYFEKTGYYTPFENPKTIEKAQETLQKHLEEDPELLKRARQQAVRTYKQKDPDYKKRSLKTKQTYDRYVAENPNYWKDRWQKSQKTLEKEYEKAGSKELYDKEQYERRKRTLISKYGSLDSYYDYRTDLTRKKYMKEFGMESYRNSEEFREKYLAERQAQLENFRKENPSVYPMEEILSMFSEAFKKYDIIPFRQNIIITSALEEIGLQINDYFWGNGDMSKRFHGCEITNIETIKDLITPIVERECEDFFKNSFRSKGEKELFEYVKSLVGEDKVVNNKRALITTEKGNGLELDVYVPSMNVAFEYNGTYWHSLEIVKDKYYHLNKTQKCAELGIRLIHIWDYEWLFETEKVKMLIKTILLSKTKVSARKCTIARITPHEEEEFLNTYHYEGYKESFVCYGLYYDNTLVQVMSLSKPEDNVAQYELLRLCTKTDLIILGGAERMFKHFLFDYNPESVVSYCDRDKFSGGIYGKLNFSSESWRPIESLIKVENGEYHRITESQINELNWVEINNLDKDNYCDIYNSGRETYVWKR